MTELKKPLRQDPSTSFGQDTSRESFPTRQPSSSLTILDDTAKMLETLQAEVAKRA
jgi:hypothetical protein